MLRFRYQPLFLLFLALGGLTRAEFLDSELMGNTMEERLQRLRKELIEAKKKSLSEEPAEKKVINDALEDLNKEAEEVEKKAAESPSVDTKAKSDDQESGQRKFLRDSLESLSGEGEEIDKQSEKSPAGKEKETNGDLEPLSDDLKALKTKEKEEKSKEPSEKNGKSDKQVSGAVDGVNKETENGQSSAVGDEEVDKDVSSSDNDTTDGDKDEALDLSDVTDGIFYVAAGLADDIKEQCDIDIAAIFTGFSPATLSAANEAGVKLHDATKALSDLLAKTPGFADDLEQFVNSSEFKCSAVAENIDKAIENIDKTLSSVDKLVFCAEARIIAIRLQMTLYGGTGFANGYMCNKVFVVLSEMHMNATKLLKAASNESFVKNCSENLVDDIKCYEQELKVYNKVIPTTPFTEESPLQTVAFTYDFLIDYGVILMYHRLVLILEAEIVKLCAESKDKDKDKENDIDKKEQKQLDEETENLTDQLQKLLRKLKEVSAKKKDAEKSLIEGRGSTGIKDQSSGIKMPSAGDKTAVKRSYYREREGNVH